MTLAVGTGGAPVYLPAGGVSESPYAALMGRPVIPCEQLPVVGDAGDIMLTAPSQYIWAPAGGTEAATSIHVAFDYGQTAYRFTMWADGVSWWGAAITPYSDGDSVGPFIDLEARA